MKIKKILNKIFAFVLICIFVFQPHAAIAVNPTTSARFDYASSRSLSTGDSASLSITGSITVDCYIKPDTWNAAGVNVIMSKVNGSISAGGWQFAIEDRGGGVMRLGLQVSNGSVTTQAWGNTDWASPSKLDTWTNVRATWTAGAANRPTIYIDGVDDGAAESVTGSTAISDTNTATYIGAQNNSGTPIRFWDGNIVMCHVYNADIGTTNINSCVPLGATTNLQMESLWDGTLNDNSGNSNTLTNNNSVSFLSDVPSVCASAAIPERRIPLIIIE